MDASAAAGRLSDLARTCAEAEEPSALLTGALPVVLELSGAHAAMVFRRTTEGYAVTAGAGADLAVDELPDDLVVEERGHLIDVPVPAEWKAADLEQAKARRLPGLTGVILLAWGPDATWSPTWLDAALDIVDDGLARLDAEERLSDLTTRVNNAQQLANMGDYDWHIASNTNRWSDQLYRIYGHEPQAFELTYERFLSHVHPDDRDRIAAIHQQAYATGEPYQMIERIVRPDGEVRFLSSNGQVIQNAEGTPIRMRGTCIDITDRVRAEEGREQSAARFRSLVESCPDAILVLDRDGVILQANGRAGSLLGGDPVGQALQQILPTEGASGEAMDATGFDGRALHLDVTTAELSQLDDDGLVAVFLHDAAPRLASETLAASLRESKVRRRQALEINDNVVQGLSAGIFALEAGATAAASSYLERTLSSARTMMNDLLDPLNGADLQPGDLVRSNPSSLDGETVEQMDLPVLSPRGGKSRRIMIADDYEDVRTLLRLQLESLGRYEIVGEAADGEEAVRMATELQPDVVLLDLAMPRMDGLQALPLIRDAVPGVRVIILSGFDQSMLAEKALAAGASRYVEKGLKMNLGEVIEGVLQQH